MGNDYILETQNIFKRFGSVTALNDVNFKVRRGEIHVLCGENGAGKSTLMNVISGVYPHGTYEGKFFYNGEECRFSSVSDSEEKGIAIIHQHLALFPLLSVAENIFINNEFAKKGIINWDETRQKAQELIDSIGINVNPTTLVKDIGVGKKQLVEICKAISRDVKLLILDEPTAALNEKESEDLLNMLLDFKKRGITSILITHKLNEIGKVCDTITVLRDGSTIETLEKGKDDISIGHIVKAMVGREMTNLYPEREHKVGDVLFEIKDWTVYHPLHIDIEVLHKVSLNVRKGEVLGIAGLMGAGRTELAMSVFGRSYGQNISGELYLHGKKLNIKSTGDAIKAGLAYVSEDRHEYGLIKGMSIKDNITLASLKQFIHKGSLDSDREIMVAQDYKGKLRIKCKNVDQKVDELSGGNQQKVIFSRWVMAKPEVVILDEPTRGIDVGSKYEIYQIINELVAEGKGVIFISSDMPEIIGMSDRVYVLNEGSIIAELDKEDISQVNIMSAIMEGAKDA
ncbi:MAG TPA: sugar ABC transporter ATP-binding protein [Candidatus Pullichristensenella excrementigallinarum]|uniref:Sugar ABC transporter ATP-binding protein n=1 Tax=Candidatus Pullichristensenella excrementigallinarum TaxID=2840907 RepID=A0A9D1LB80_9FIRM|nr:sugar ABC transporter ATP-binding protein [Candidatus Pullichristensenella excrementigallinarum]